MIHIHEPTNDLKICNAILPPMERDDIVRAAKFADANRHMAAEYLREKHGYSRSDCLTDVDKIGIVR